MGTKGVSTPRDGRARTTRAPVRPTAAKRRRAPSDAARLAAFIREHSPRIAREGRAALARLRRHAPGAVELVYDNYAGLVVGFCATDRPSDAVFSLVFRPEWLTLCFLQDAARLPDPASVLRGSGGQVRHVRLEAAADLDRPAIRALLRIAVARARVPIIHTGGRRIIVRIVAPRRRPRRQ